MDHRRGKVPAFEVGRRIAVRTPWGVYHGVVEAVDRHGVWLRSPAGQSPPIVPLSRAPSGPVAPAFLGMLRMFGTPRSPFAPPSGGADPGPPSWSGGASGSPPGAGESGGSSGFLGFLSGRNRFWWLPLAFYGLRLFF